VTNTTPVGLRHCDKYNSTNDAPQRSNHETHESRHYELIGRLGGRGDYLQCRCCTCIPYNLFLGCSIQAHTLTSTMAEHLACVDFLHLLNLCSSRRMHLQSKRQKKNRHSRRCAAPSTSALLHAERQHLHRAKSNPHYLDLGHLPHLKSP
jgi:hypothetical protein